MLEKIGRVLETDVLVIGGGAGGLWAALSAKRHLPSDRVTLVDSHRVGRTGHTAFSNAWMTVVTPEDDLQARVADIVRGNEWIAEQELIREVLSLSYSHLRDAFCRLSYWGMQRDGFYCRPVGGEIRRAGEPSRGERSGGRIFEAEN